MTDPLLLFATTFWFWFGLAALLVILELIFSTSFFLLWLGIVSAVVGVVVWFVPSLTGQYQTLLFAIGSIMSIVIWRKYCKTHQVKTDRPNLNRRAEQYVGRTFTISEPIINGRGKIRVDDTTWRVEGPDLPAGTTVLVTGVDSVTLKIKPVVADPQE